jgi:hypothetical protein
MPENADNANTDTADQSATDQTADNAGQESDADKGAADDSGAEDFKSKFEAQQKVNRDLERKLKAAPTKADTDALRAELDELRAKAEGKEAEHQAAIEAQRVKDEAIAAANERIKKAEVRAQAAAKLSDPADALRFLDLSEFEVDSDGEVDASQIASAIDDLITRKPYLAAQGGRFQGSADGGARNDSAGTGQLTRSDLDRMSPEDIAAAHEAGRFQDVLSGKR